VALAWSSRSTWIFGIILVALAVPPILNGDVIVALPPLIFGLAFLTGVFVVPVVWFQTRRRPQIFREPWELEVDERGLRYRSPLGTGAYPWTAFKRMRERAGFIYLEIGSGSTLIVPATAFEGPARATFDRLVRDAGFGRDGRRRDGAGRAVEGA
jgi:hypothetical protein